MQNLILFLRKYHYIFLFVLLEVYCFYALYKFSNYHETALFNASNAVSGTVLESRDNITEYLHLRGENDRLLLETAQELEDLETNQIMMGADTFYVTDSTEIPLYSFIPARVIHKTIRKKANYFIINRGSNHSVSKDMGVVSQDGVVGIVVNTSRNFSTVMTVLHEDFNLTPRIAGFEQYGKLYWTGPNPEIASIDRISKHIELERGMEVSTSLFSRYFPPSYRVGYISKLDKNPKSSYWDIDVKLATDFKNVRSVYIIQNNFKAEIDSLNAAQ